MSVRTLHPFRPLLLRFAISALAGGAVILPASGQALAPAPEATDQTKVIELSPFTVNETQDRGYVAANTIAGSRLNTKLSDTPAAISVFDTAFLNDIGALTTVDALAYMLNGHQDYSDTTGLANSIQQDFQVKVRGLFATVTRDYFDNPNSNSLDGFNTERIDFARGPNSTLYGVGNPGGVVNTTTKTAVIGQNIDQLQLRVGSFDDSRVTIDENYSAGDKLAVRVNGVIRNSKSWKDFADMDLQALAGAVVYRPLPTTRIDIQSEYDDRKEVLAKYFLPQNFAGAWLNAGRPIATSDTTPVAGTSLFASTFLIYDPTAQGGGLMSWKNTLQTVSAPVSPEIGGVTQSVTDTSIVPRSANLAGSGSNVNEWFGFTTLTVTQELGPVSLQLAYDHSATDRTEDETIRFGAYGIYADANPFLPNGSANPNVGKFYVQDNPRIHRDDYESDDLRATLFYKLDLSAHHLGIHSLTALASRNKADAAADAKFLTDLTGNGNPKLSAAANAVYYRTYLNFGSGDLSQRGSADPSLYPIRNINGTTADFEQTTAATTATTTLLDTVMIADQSTFWDNRFVVTAGIRNDVQALYNGAVGPADPVTGLFPMVTPYQSESVVHGNTRTVGAVFNVLPWLGVFYDNSDDFSPQSTISVNGLPIGPKTGQDQDWGVKFNLPNNRAYLTLTHYQIAQTNAQPTDTTLSLSILPEINDIWNALNLPVVPSTSAFDTVDNQGKGWEADLVANVTPNWRLMFNASQNILSEQNVLPRFGAYIATNQALWQKNAATPLVAPFTAITNNTVNPTIADAIAAINSNLALDRLTSAEVPRGQTKYTFSGFTAYTIDSDNPWVKALTFGGGVNYTGPTVTGYDLSHNFAPIYSGANILFNGMLAKSVRFKAGTLKLQLNVQNVFANNNLIATVKDNTGTYQYRLQPPRSWSLTSTYSY